MMEGAMRDGLTFPPTRPRGRLWPQRLMKRFMKRFFLLGIVVLVLGAAFGAEATATMRVKIDRDVGDHLARLMTEFPDRDNARFMKLGGSSVVSRAFLHCFETPHVEFGGREALEEVRARFSARRGSPFTRQSEGTRVGLNLRHLLTGRTPLILRELRATNARFALLFAGANDVMGRNPEIFAERLDRAITLLLDRGVMPILGSIPPRPRSKEIDSYVEEFNRITRETARERALPFIDFHAVMSELPKAGLARDGVHPNVYRVGGRARPCDFSEEGLKHGYNVRNLLVLETLAALSRIVDEVEARVEFARAYEPVGPPLARGEAP